jgi:hypothetical protein
MDALFFTFRFFSGEEYFGESFTWQSQEYWDLQTKTSLPRLGPSPAKPLPSSILLIINAQQRLHLIYTLMANSNEVLWPLPKGGAEMA